MGLETTFLISAGIQLASGFVEFREQKKADKQAKRRAEAEARLLEQDAARAAELEAEEAERTRKLQKVAFLKSGVTLEGSPLLVMEETRRKGEENVENVRRNAKARADLLRQQGKITRANLFGTALDTASGITSSFVQSEILKKQLE